MTNISHTIVNPDGLHDPVPFGYSHTATIPAGTELVLVSGQYGSGTDGAVVSTDFAEQVQQAFRNLGVALAAHGLDLSHVVQLRTYVVNPDFDKLGAIGPSLLTSWFTTYVLSWTTWLRSSPCAASASPMLRKVCRTCSVKSVETTAPSVLDPY